MARNNLAVEPFYLGNDLYVNELAAKNGRQMDPNSEWIHDLGNDLRVNKIAEKQGWTPNPDAETIEDLFDRKSELNAEWPIDSVADNFDIDLVDVDNDIDEGESRSKHYYYATAADR